MRLMLEIVVGVTLFVSSHSFATEESPIHHPIVQHLKAMGEKAWPEPGAIMQGGVKFVLGNNIWQPGQEFKNGHDWLALACSKEGCVLEPAELSVKRESWQGHYDDKPTSGQKLSFKISSGVNRSVVAWFNTQVKHSWLKPDAITTYYSALHGIKRPIGKGTLEALVDLPGGKVAELVPLLLTIESLDKLRPERRHDYPAYLLQLRAYGTRQLLLWNLGTCEGSSAIDPKEYLRWAGDLDKDGEADFLISFIDQDGPVHLYLSSVKETDQLVGLAGVYASPPFSGECYGG